MKIKTLLKGPVLTQSGYGKHAREILTALLQDPIFDVHVENINWGHTSFLTENTEEKQTIRKLVEKRVAEKHNGNNKFDLFVHITIPNEFERQGTFNVGVTAGIEVDRVAVVWVQKCNEMDLIVVPSEHSKESLCNTIVEWQDPRTQQSGQMKVVKPVIVCHEGVDTSLFLPRVIEKNLFDLEPEFNFLHVGQWGRGTYGEDRKNIALLVKYFIETFKGRKDVGLVLKVNMAKNSLMDYSLVKTRLQEIKSNFKAEDVPSIYLIHANLTDEEMADLYNHPKIKAFISLTHGEGFGLPLLEASACGLPVIATNWSGHLDFLNRGKWLPVEYDLREIPDVAVWENVMIKGSRWANAKEDDVKRKMRKIISSYIKPYEWAQELSATVRDEFDTKKVGENFVNTIRQHLIRETESKISPQGHLQAFIDTPNDYNVIYTMPMSAGDVYISTAVIDGLVKELPPECKIYFATDMKYVDILKDNPHIHKVIPWNETMINVDLLEGLFDLALTPNVATQYTFSNWIKRGQGRLLADEYANHCNTKLGNYFIQKEAIEGFNESGGAYLTFHPGSGVGRWEARNYEEWSEVLQNLKSLYPDLKVVQVGAGEDKQYAEVDIDLRGKTSYNQLAQVLSGAVVHVGIDSAPMHVAAGLGTPLVAIFGCSYASSTGPWVPDMASAKYILLQSERRSGCVDRACYKNRCVKNPDGNGPINEIAAEEIFKACVRLLKEYE
jgi:ADP-heptose:LPS heptosyltransferase/glycosyltransferase involved in cell wall biosynthesis